MNAIVPGAMGKASQGETGVSRLGGMVKRIVSLVSARRSERRLRLREMLPLGEKRFIAVVEYGRENFILAGTPQSISLLKTFRTNDEGAGNAREAATDAE